MSKPSYFKLIFSLFVHIFIVEISIQDTYDPLVLIKRYDDGIRELATLDPRDKLKFEIKNKDKLNCYCPQVDPREPLIQTEECPTVCEENIIPTLVYPPKTRAECATDGRYTCSGYKIELIPFLLKMPGISWAYQYVTRRYGLVGFQPVLNICQNYEDEVLFIRYTLRAPSHLKQEMSEITTQEMQRSKYLYGWPGIFQLYEKENQKKSFQRLFGDDHERYFNWPDNENETQSTERYFYLQQLAESDDMVLDTWKRATYFYKNTAPMWISVSEGSWRKANHLVRLLSHKLNTQFYILAGTYGNLIIDDKPIILYDIKGQMNIPVPLIFWKIFYNRAQKVGLVIVTYNDIDSVINQDFCNRTPCPKLKECNLENLDDKEIGIAFCCEFDEELELKLNLSKLELPELVHLNAENVNEEGQLIINSQPASTSDAGEKDPKVQEDDVFFFVINIRSHTRK